MKRRTFLVLALAAAYLPVAAVIIRDDKADSLYTDLGGDVKYVSVGLINYRTDTSRGIATGVFIGSGTDGNKWMLTAAHVLDDADLTSMTFTVGGNTYNVPIASTRFLTGTGTGSRDIGVGQISDPDNTLTIAPARFTNFTLPIPDNLNARTIGTGVGFGDTGNGRDGASGNDGKKRGFQNVLDCLNGTYDDGNRNLYGYQADFDDTTAGANTLDGTDNAQVGFPASQKSSRTWLNLEGLGAEGDSGGGLFADIGGSTLLVGIESGNQRVGSTGLDRYGSCTVWTPLDAEMAGNVTRWTGIQPAPEPISGLAIATGLLLLSVRRGRTR